MPASQYAITALRQIGLDLADHRSRALTPELLARAAHTYCMSRSHLVVCRMMFDELGDVVDPSAKRPQLLAENLEIADPFGGELETYCATRDQIREALQDGLAWSGTA
jgi:protein-tyrosine-phosphatase